MTAIIDFFASCGDVIISVVEWFGSMLDNLMWVVSVVPTFIASMNLTFVYMPNFIVPFFSISLSIMGVYAVIKLL